MQNLAGLLAFNVEGYKVAGVGGWDGTTQACNHTVLLWFELVDRFLRFCALAQNLRNRSTSSNQSKTVWLHA